MFEAVREFDRLGRDGFLRHYGFGTAVSVYLVIAGQSYDSKAIVGVAHGFARPDLGPLGGREVKEGINTVGALLRNLGFEVEQRVQRDSVASTPAPEEWHLRPGDTITRKSLHARYGGRRQGGIGPSVKTPNVLVFTDPSIGEQHGYLDRWEGTTLHYTGEGQVGDQQMTQGNRTIRDHVDEGRALRVFEGAKGTVRYTGEFALDPVEPWYYDTAPSTGAGPPRQVIMFRLSPLGPFSIEGKTHRPDKPKPSLNAPYRRLEDTSTSRPESLVFTRDPNLADRGTNAHRRLQNTLSGLAEAHGMTPNRPEIGDPLFDNGWWDGEVFVLVEVKSITAANEITQLRLGLGQVLDYKATLDAAGVPNRAVLAVESEPPRRWVDLAREHGVRLVWPDLFAGLSEWSQ